MDWHDYQFCELIDRSFELFCSNLTTNSYFNWNFDRLLFSYIFFTPTPHSQLFRIPNKCNQSHIIAIVDEINNVLKPDSFIGLSCAFTYHNIRGGANEKFNESEYYNLIISKYDPTFLWFVETKMTYNKIKDRKGFKIIFKPAIETERGGIACGIYGMINTKALEDISILEEKWYLIVILRHIAKEVHMFGYASPYRNDIFHAILRDLVKYQEYCIANEYLLILTADLNAKLGEYLGNNEINERGTILLNLVKERQLCVLNEKYCKNEATCGKNMIDLVIISDFMNKYDFNMHIDSKFGSDHNLIHASIQSSFDSNNFRSIFDDIVRYNRFDKNYYFIKKSRLQMKFNRKLYDDNKNSIINNICNIFFTTRNKYIISKNGIFDNYNNIWFEINFKLNQMFFDYNILFVVNNSNKKKRGNFALYGRFGRILAKLSDENDKLRKFKSKLRDNERDNIENRIIENEKLVLSILNFHRMEKQSKIAKMLDNAILNHDSKTYFKILRNMSNKTQIMSSFINGILDFRDCTNMIEIENEAKKRFEPKNKNDILFCTIEMLLSYFDDINPKYSHLTKCPNLSEIDCFFTNVNKNASEAFDLFDINILLHLRQQQPSVLMLIFQDIWHCEKLNSIAALQKIIAIPKKEPNKKRFINTMSVLSKAVEFIAGKRIEKQLIEKIGNKQFAYKERIGINFVFFNIQTIFAHFKYIYKKCFYLVPMDLEKAYNNVRINILMLILFWGCETVGKLFRILYNYFLFDAMVFKCNNIYSSPIIRKIGLKEGGVFSGTLFNVSNETMLNNALNPQLGIKLKQKPDIFIELEDLSGKKYDPCPWNDIPLSLEYEIINNIEILIERAAFADDVNLISDDFYKMQKQLQQLGISCDNFGSIVNGDKSNAMKCGNNDSLRQSDKYFLPFMYRTGPIKFAKNVNILGRIFSQNGSLKHFLKKILQKVTTAAISQSNDIEFAMRIDPMIAIENYKYLVCAKYKTSLATTPWNWQQMNKINCTILNKFCEAIGMDTNISFEVLAIAAGFKHVSHDASWLRLSFFL